MNLYRIENMKSGWFVGAFEPAAFYSEHCEVNYRIHRQGEFWDKHYHTSVTEITLLIKGRMKLQGKELVSGDIFVLHPYEVADPEFLEDCETVCVKFPSINDKVVIK